MLRRAAYISPVRFYDLDRYERPGDVTPIGGQCFTYTDGHRAARGAPGRLAARLYAPARSAARRGRDGARPCVGRRSSSCSGRCTRGCTGSAAGACSAARRDEGAPAHHHGREERRAAHHRPHLPRSRRRVRGDRLVPGRAAPSGLGAQSAREPARHRAGGRARRSPSPRARRAARSARGCGSGSSRSSPTTAHTSTAPTARSRSWCSRLRSAALCLGCIGRADVICPAGWSQREGDPPPRSGRATTRDRRAIGSPAPALC